MGLRKLHRNPHELETLSLFAAVEPDGATTVDDLKQQQGFLAGLGQGLSRSLADQARLHGWRVQELFKALIVELGQVSMVKDEDQGDLYFDDQDGKLKLPDLRLILANGSTAFVEVKNVGPKKVRSTTIGRGELESLERYAEKQGAQLLLAHYWSAWNLWTLFDPNCLDRSARRVNIPMETAMRENSLGALGDRHLGTRPPLTMTLHSDPEQPATLQPAQGESRTGQFTIGSVEYAAAGKPLGDPDEIRIAATLMHFGKWEVDNEAEVVDGRLRAIRYVFAPPDGDVAHAEQGFAIAGTLSSIYSTLFNLGTLKDDGSVARLRREPTPGGLSCLVPDDYFERTDRVLELWCFEQRPRGQNEDGD